MADNRKTLESIPVPASGAAPDVLTTTEPATSGADMGGITRTADSALGESIGLTGDIPPIGADTSGGAAGAGRTGGTAGHAGGTTAGTGATSKPPTQARDDAQVDSDTPEDESPLESLGKAIAAPLSGEALKDEPRR